MGRRNTERSEEEEKSASQMMLLWSSRGVHVLYHTFVSVNVYEAEPHQINSVGGFLIMYLNHDVSHFSVHQHVSPVQVRLVSTSRDAHEECIEFI